MNAFAPFTSSVADIYGNRLLAETLARRNGWECHLTNDANSAAVAILVKPTHGDEAALTIEVLNEVNGLTEADLDMNTLIELAVAPDFARRLRSFSSRRNSTIWFRSQTLIDRKTSGIREC